VLPQDLAALSAWAAGLTGPGVLVVGQPLWSTAGGSTDYNPRAFVPEFQQIWRALRDAPWEILIRVRGFTVLRDPLGTPAPPPSLASELGMDRSSRSPRRAAKARSKKKRA
jgi:hypothetical protein